MSGLGSSSPEDVKKFDKFLREGVITLQSIDDLRGGLREMTKALAAEFNLEPKKLTEALRIEYKDTLADKKETMSVIEEIMHLTGRG